MRKDMLQLTEETFSSSIQEGTTLVDFYADWCGPCRMMAPILEELSEEMKQEAKIAKLDIDANQKVASQFKITSIPTLVLFKQGKEVGRVVGLKDREAIVEFIQKGKTA